MRIRPFRAIPIPENKMTGLPNASRQAKTKTISHKKDIKRH